MSKTEKILLLTFEMPPVITGGIGTVAFETAAELKNQGKKVTIIAPGPGDAPYYKIPVRNNFLKLAVMLVKAFWAALRERPDFIYSLTGTYPGFVALILKKVLGIPYFVVAHGLEFVRFENKIIIKRFILTVFRNASLVFAVSNFTRQKLVEFGLNNGKIKVCYNGVDLKKFKPESEQAKLEFRKKYKLLPDSFVLLTISRLDPRKGHINSLKAMHNIFIKYPDLKTQIFYLIAGKGPLFKEIEAFIHEHSLADNVSLLGFIEETEKNELYNVCDLFLHPNIYIQKEGNIEGFGIVFLEAAAAGKTGIGGREGGSGEAILNNITGFTVDGSDINEIENRILELYNDREKLASLSSAAYQRTVSKFTWEFVVKNILTEIDNSLA